MTDTFDPDNILADVPTAPAEPFDPAAALEQLHIAPPEPVEIAPSTLAPTPHDLLRKHLTVIEGFTDEAVDALFGDAPPAPVNTGNPKDALGDKKVDLSLVPPASVLYQAMAMQDGAAKYGPYNWRENKVRARVYVAAGMRHLAQFLDGEDIDPTSGRPHLGHALACLGIIVDAQTTGNLIDDRPLPGSAGRIIRGE